MRIMGSAITMMTTAVPFYYIWFSELPELTAFCDFRCVVVDDMVCTRSAGPTLSETAENMEHLALGSAGSSVEDVVPVASGGVGQIESAAPAPAVSVADGPVSGTAGSKERAPSSVDAGAVAGKGKVLRLKGGASPDSVVVGSGSGSRSGTARVAGRPAARTVAGARQRVLTPNALRKRRERRAARLAAE